MRLLWFFAVLFFLLPCPVSAAQLSGDYLVYVCGADQQGKELVKGGHTTCQAYIAGVLDYHRLIESLGTGPSVDFCIPEGTKLSELQSVVLDYLSRHRSQHDGFNATPAVALAFYERYPCK